ncbi:MAG: hypothetical protein ACP5OC_03235 [Thermoplasmata archaeon]
MMQKRNRMIMFAIIAAVIVASPISFLFLLPPVQSFSVTDGNISHIYEANLSNVCNSILHHEYLKLNAGSVAYHAKQTSLAYFKASTCFFGTYMNETGLVYTGILDYNFRGNVSSSLHPIEVTVTLSALYRNGSLDNNVVIYSPWFYHLISDPYERNVSNTTSTTGYLWERGSGTIIFPLDNFSRAIGAQRYYFCLGNLSEQNFLRNFCVYYNPPIVSNLTLDLTIKAISRTATLVDNFTIYLIDTGI